MNCLPFANRSPGQRRRTGSWPRSRSARRAVLPLTVTLLVTGCGSTTVSPLVNTTPRPQPTPTPTLVLGFAVQVTPFPTRHVTRRKPRPTPTRFVPPRFAPYLALYPTAGPPVSRTIFVRGGNLPRSQSVDLVWSPGGHVSPLSTTTGTDRGGNLAARFSVPGSPPGRYQVIAEIGGVPVAAAWYAVTSAASLRVQVLTGGSGDNLLVTGQRFLPDLSLVLVAYPVFTRKAYLLGAIRTGTSGRFSFRYASRRLAPGQYVLRAYSTSAVSAQMAEAPFEVVI